MTKARFLRSAALEELRGKIPQNLPAYRTGNFLELVADPSYWFEHDLDIDFSQFDKLRAPEGNELFEVENCHTTYSALHELSPYEARDERFWAYLSHTALLEHGRTRWPIPANDSDAIKHIAKHFFGRDKRQIERDNVGSRLWWVAHLCARVESMTHEQALQAFLFRSDVRANIVERPTTSQSSELFSAIVQKLSLSFQGGKHLFERPIFRQFMKEINSIGGYKLLDCLTRQRIEAILDDIITSKLEISQL